MSNFTVDDFKAGQRIELNYSKDRYLLLTNKFLANMNNGRIYKKYYDAFWDIKKVISTCNKVLAIEVNQKLKNV